MTIAQTTLSTYIEIKPNIAGNQLIVYNAVVRNPKSSNQDIAAFLHWPINSVTPRTLELREKEYIRICGTKKNAAGRTVQIMEAVT